MLRAEGHPSAEIYPLFKLYAEAEMVRSRVKKRIRLEAQMQFLALGAAKATKKNREPLDAFNREMEKLNE